jgi:TonB-linked SusC/RagA family outer membrane protein
MEKIMKHIRIGVVLLGLCLCFSIVTMGQAEIVLNSELAVNDSLVNVAYRTVNKYDLSNAISVLNPSEYIDKSYGSYALEGSNAFIGGSNFWNLGSVLVLIDGVPRSIDNVILSEIDQVTYLKGANAVVLYGSRAANGVILITTKRGYNGERKSNVYINAGLIIPKSYPNYLGSAEYMTYYNQARSNDGLTSLYDSATISNYASHSNTYRYPDVDYYSSEYLKKIANSYSASADFTGGNDRAQFYALAGFQSQNSLLNFGEGKNENILRLNIRGNINLKLNDYISTFVNMSNVFYDAKLANGNYWSNAATLQPHRFAPLVPIDLVEKDAENAQTQIENGRNMIDGKYLLGGTQEYLTNPIADVYVAGSNTYTSRQFQYLSGVDINLVNLLKGLSFHGQIGIDYSNSYMQSVNNTYAVYVPTWKDYDGTDSISELSKFNKDANNGSQNLSNNWNSQVIDFNVHFDYKNTFNEKHNISAMLLAAAYKGRQTGDFQNRTNSNLGLEIDYNYAHKYYIDFSGALVNSTKLAPGNRLGFSPTINLGWIISEEDFMKGSGTIDRLKISASAGIVNTDMDIANYYLYDEEYSSTAYFSWRDGEYVNRATTISRGENKNLTYAKRKEVNVGIDGSFFNKSIEIQANVFLIKKDGIPVQSYTLYPSFFRTYWPETSFVPYVNFAADSYRGFDFKVNFNKKLGEVDLTLGISGTYVTTEALVRDELYEDTYRNRAGKPTDAIFGLENEGFFMDQSDIDNHAAQKFGEVKPGDIKYKDQNGDGIINERDEVVIGNWNSPLSGGVHFTAKWKNFTLFAMGNAWFGGTNMKSGLYYWVYGDRKYSDVVRGSWTEETKNTATYPRLTTLSGDNNFRYSDFWTFKDNAFNLSKVQLTYSLPDKLLKGSFVKGLNLYVNGSNLLLVSENKDIMELNIGTSPQARYFSLGIKAVF